MDADHYAKLEELFARLAPSVTPLMSNSEVAFGEEYLDAGEYGLALETIVDDLIREGAAIPEMAYHEIETLSRLMEGVVDERLSSITVTSIWLLAEEGVWHGHGDIIQEAGEGAECRAIRDLRRLSWSHGAKCGMARRRLA